MKRAKETNQREVPVTIQPLLIVNNLNNQNKGLNHRDTSATLVILASCPPNLKVAQSVLALDTSETSIQLLTRILLELGMW